MPKQNIIPTKYCDALSYYKQGQGIPVVFIHGFPEDASIWFELMEQLSNECLLLALDLPGVGGSKGSNVDLSIDNMAHCVKEVLDFERIESAIIVGHSMGGYIALSFTALYESMVSGLMLVHSTASADTEEKIANREKAIKVIEKGGKEIFIKQMVGNLFSDDYKTKFTELVANQVQKSLKIKESSLIAFYNAMIKRSDRSDILLNKDIPVHWVIGMDDSVTPVKSVIQHCIAANVNFVSLYESCAHMSMMEQKELLQKDLQSFSKYCLQNK